MATVIDAVLRLRDSFTPVMQNVTARLTEHQQQQQRVAKSIQNTGKSISSLGAKMMALSAPIMGAAIAGAKLNSEFATGLAKVSTLVDTTVVDMQKMRAGMVDLSNELGVSVTELTEGTYQAISAGVKEDKVLGFMKVSAKGARAGFSDLTTTTDALTNVINAYGMQTEDANIIMDKFIVTQNLGKTTVDELSKSLGQVTPTAAQVGVGLDELLASVAALTAAGIKTPEAITALKAALSNIIKPSEQASKFAKQLGIDFSASHLKSVGWAKFLEEIKEKTGGNAEAMSKLFGSTEALNAIMVLTGNGADKFAESLNGVENAAGATDEAVAKMDATPAVQLAKAVNSLKNASMELAQGLTPLISRTAIMTKAFADFLNNLTPFQKELLFGFAQFVIVGGVALTVIGKLVTKAGSMYGAFIKAGVAVQKAGGVIPALKEASSLFSLLSSASVRASAMLKSGLGTLGNVIVHPFAALRTVAKGAFSILKSGGSMIVTVFSKAFSVLRAIPTLFTKLGSVILHPIASIRTLFTVFSKAFSVLRAIPSLFTKLASVILHPIASIKTLFTVFVNGFKMLRLVFAANPVGIALLALTLVITYVIAHWKTFEQVIKTVWSHVSGTISAAIGRVKPVFERLWQAVQGAFNKIKSALNLGENSTRECGRTMSIVINTLGSVFSAVFAVISAVVEVAVSVVANSITTAINVFGDIIQFLNCVFVGDWRGVWESVKQIFTDIVEGIKQTFSDVINSISGMLDRIIGKSSDAKAAAADAQAESDGGGESDDSGSDETEEHWTGSTWFHGGNTLVNEKGAELINLPTGAQIVPHSESLKQQYQKGFAEGQAKQKTSMSVSIAKLADSIVVREETDIDKIADSIVFKLKQYSINNMQGAY